MRMKEIIRNTFRKKYLAIVLGAFLLLPLFIQSGTRQAFGLTSNLFSGAKEFELTHPLPNVMILWDNSLHLQSAQEIQFVTHGDGSKPFQHPAFFGNKRQYYFGWDLGPWQADGAFPEVPSNNDVTVDLNYHPLLKYIPDELLPPITSTYLPRDLDYDVVSCDPWDGLDYSMDYENAFIQPPANPGVYPKGWKLVNSRRTPFLRTATGSPTITVDLPYFPRDAGFSVDTPGYRPPLKEGFSWCDVSGSDSRVYLLEYKTGRTEKKKYKFPNDSFAYMVKNFFYRFLGEDEILKNVRFALATKQMVLNTNEETSTIYWYNGREQKTLWTDNGLLDRDRAKLWENFGHSKEHREKVREYFDGTEIYDTDPSINNPELRLTLWGTGFGGALIGHPTDSVLEYFKAPTGITDWCQENYLILLYDGSYIKPDLVDRVSQLYNQVITRDGKECKKIKTFVIALESYIPPNALPTQAEVRALFDAAAVAGQTGLDKAFYPHNVDEFLAAIRTIFAKINETAATGSAPLVSPPRVSGDRTRAYSAGFTTKTNTQWPGYLYSYTVSDDVVNWEAGAELDVQSADLRIIYTVDWKKAGANLKDFTKNNAADLRPLMAPISQDILPDDKLEDFIDWTRGKDIWGENAAEKKAGPERWKLGDPYHVGLVSVGKPSSLLKDGDYLQFADDYKDRPKRIYLHSNDGMVHAFDRETGKEKWAFIPPNVLSYNRLLGTKYNPAYGWINEDWASYAQYLLDGPLVAEDIFTDGQYRTVLLGSLGRGGAGLYALDVTEADSPKFLWALENNYYHENQVVLNARLPADQTFMTWKAANPNSSPSLVQAHSRQATLPSKLRLTLSTPFIGKITTDTGIKWVALLGAGTQKPPLNSSIDPEPQADKGGKAYYLLDMANGSMVAQLTHADLGMVVSPVSVESIQNHPLLLKKFYSGDHLGAVYEGDLSSLNQDDWLLNKIYSSTNVSGIPYAIEVGLFKNNKWLFWGTGNPDDLFGDQSGDCFFTALNRSAVGADPATRDDLFEIDPESGESAFDESSGKIGWYFPFSEHEFITTPSVLYKGHVFFATYTPAFKADGTPDLCNVGNSNIYILNGLTGLGGWKSGGVPLKKIQLIATRVSGISVTGGKVYMGLTRYPGAPNIDGLPSQMANIILKKNLLIFDVPEDLNPVNPGSGIAQPTYWRDWKP